MAGQVLEQVAPDIAGDGHECVGSGPAPGALGHVVGGMMAASIAKACHVWAISWATSTSTRCLTAY